MDSMNGCQPSGTFMEEAVVNITASTNGIARTDERINQILNKLRGSRPSTLSAGNEKQPESGLISKITDQLKIQNNLLNSISTNLEELENLL